MKTDRIEAAYKFVKKYFGIRNTKSEAIKKKQGTIIYEQKHIAERWKGYLVALYDGEELTGQEVEEMNENE